MHYGHDFYRDESGSILGPDVRVILTLRATGDTVVERMPAALAVAMVLHDDVNNGELYSSARIDFGNLIDIWGGSA